MPLIAQMVRLWPNEDLEGFKFELVLRKLATSLDPSPFGLRAIR